MMVHGHHHMTQAKTQYQYVEFNLDDSDWSWKDYMTQVKTQYQYVQFSMDDWGVLFLHCHF